MKLPQPPPFICCWIWLGILSVACGGAVDNGSSLATGMVSSGGVQPPGGIKNPGAGGALNLPANSGAGGASTSSPSNTGGQSGCNYNGQWYPAGSEWDDGDGCGCTGNYPDAGILVMRHCSSNYCMSDGFVSRGPLGTYCPVELDASAEVCAAEECIYLVTTDEPDAS